MVKLTPDGLAYAVCKRPVVTTNSKEDTLKNRDDQLLKLIDDIVEARVNAPTELIAIFVGKLTRSEACNEELAHLDALNPTTSKLRVKEKKELIRRTLIDNAEELQSAFTKESVVGTSAPPNDKRDLPPSHRR